MDIKIDTLHPYDPNESNPQWVYTLNGKSYKVEGRAQAEALFRKSLDSIGLTD